MGKKPDESGYAAATELASISVNRVGGDLVDTCMVAIERLRRPYAELGEAQQQAVIDEVERAVTNALRMSAHIIAARGVGPQPPFMHAYVKRVTIKESEVAEALVVVPLDARQQLSSAAELAGGPCVIVGVDLESWTAGLGERKPEPDQRTLRVDTETGEVLL